MNVDQMEARIKEHFPDADVVAIDLTGTSDHWEVRVASTQFKHQTRIQQHQSVMKAFDAEFKTGEVHALSIKQC